MKGVSIESDDAKSKRFFAVDVVVVAVVVVAVQGWLELVLKLIY